MNVDEIIQEMAKDDIYLGEMVGFAPTEPEKWRLFLLLKKIASVHQLESLLQHENPSVRCYAFKALVDQQDYDIFPLLLHHIEDVGAVMTFYLDLGSKVKLFDFYFNEAKHKLTDQQIGQIDACIVEKNLNLRRKEEIFRTLEPTEQNYAKIRRYVVDFHNDVALAALSKYGKVEDVPIILKYTPANPRYKFEAISHNPVEEYREFLVSSLDEHLKSQQINYEALSFLYGAIAKYQNVWAAEQLKRPLREIHEKFKKEQHLEMVVKQLCHNFCDLYAPYIFLLWEEHGLITQMCFDLLAAKDAPKSLKCSERSLTAHVDNIFVQQQDGLLYNILEFVRINDEHLAIRLIVYGIEEASVTSLPPFIRFARFLEKDEFIGPLLQRFKADANPHVFLECSKALIALKRPAVNAKLIELYTATPHLQEGWGGEELTNILRQKKLI